MTSLRTLALLVVPLLALALAPPLAHAAQPNAEDATSIVTFYGHVFGTGRGAPMPMNTQFPHGEADLSQGSYASCGIAPPTCDESPDNEEWFYTTAGFVQVKTQSDFSYDKLHNERGLTKDTRLDTGQDIKATFYMSADAHGWPTTACDPGLPHDAPWPIPCWNWDPGLLLQWQVQATVYTGVLGDYGGAADKQPDIAVAVTANKLVKLAEGISAPQDVKSLEATGNPTVWKFDINLGHPARDTIKKEESYVVRFKWWSVKPDGSHRILPVADLWNVNSGEYFPPAVKLPLKGAFNVEMVVPQFVYDKLVVLGIMNTPWGSYDVDQDSIKLTIADQHGAPIEPHNIARLADFSVAHGAHYKPVNVTYVWDFVGDKLKPGTYAATVSASNYQGSASASCTGHFTVAPGGNPGEIEVGQCGMRTITDTQLITIQEGSKGDAGSSSVAAGASESAPAAALGQAPVAAAPALAIPIVGGIVMLWRRKHK